MRTLHWMEDFIQWGRAVTRIERAHICHMQNLQAKWPADRFPQNEVSDKPDHDMHFLKWHTGFFPTRSNKSIWNVQVHFRYQHNRWTPRHTSVRPCLATSGAEGDGMNHLPNHWLQTSESVLWWNMICTFKKIKQYQSISIKSNIETIFESVFFFDD